MKPKIKIAIVLLCILIFLPLVLAVVVIPVGNDLVAAGVKNALAATPLPERTQVVETYSRAAKLTGNGNGMQYFGALLLESERTLSDLQQHYAAYGYTVRPQTTAAIEVIELGGGSFRTPVAEDGFYIVYGWGDAPALLRELDIRGH